MMESVVFFLCHRGSSISHEKDHRDIMQKFSAPCIFQGECRTKIDHVLFPSVWFFKLRIRAECQKIIFIVLTRSDFWNQQKLDPRNRIV